MNATAPAEPTVIAAPIEHVFPGTNYRKRRPKDWDQKLDELAQSIKEHGLLEPIVCRPKPDAFEREDLEVVCGERRYLASKRAGLATILCTVREIPDDAITDFQVAENDQREDPHPLDQADGFAELVKKGRTPADIAARLGRDVSYVAKRLALVQLGPEGRKAFDEERISFGVALLVARIPDKTLQNEAVEAIEDAAADSRWDGPMTVEKASALIEKGFMLRLEQAPFDTADAQLVPKAGACTTCPKRTGAQRELFADVKSPDLCTDPKCHASKVDAVWQIRKKEAAKGGQQVVEGKDAAGADHGYGSSKFISLDADVYVGNKHVKVRKLLGKDAPPTALARSDAGEVFEVVPRADVNKAVRAKDKSAAREDRGASDYTRREKARQAKAKLRNQAIRLAIEQATVKAPQLDAGKVLRLVVRAFAARCWNETQRRVLDRRGIEAKGGQVEAKIVKLAKDLDDGELAGLGLELAMLAGAPTDGDRYGGTAGLWADAVKLTGVNYAAIEKSVVGQAKAKGKARTAPKAKPAKKRGRK
jgi:ParB/RepB/Spo0J family partition protein